MPATTFISNTIAKVDSYNYPDCLTGKFVREFKGSEQIVDGTKYRVDCKLKQVSTYASFIADWRVPKVVASIIFKKFKNNKWKKTKSSGHLVLAIRGKIFRQYDCTDLYYAINYSYTKSKAKKIKLKFIGIPGTQGYTFPHNFRTSRIMPDAINADYIWKYNSNQNVVGIYNQRLRP